MTLPAGESVPAVVLAIGGSDSSGGAGIQADAKAFACVGVYGTYAVTAITAQNTTTIERTHAIPGDIVGAQVRAVAADMPVRAVKLGMLLNEEIVHAVADALAAIGEAVPLVIDPVLASSTGVALLEPGAISLLVAKLFPRASFVTPNLEEARLLAREAQEGTDTMGPAALAVALAGLGPAHVIVTGGHGDGDLVDLYHDGSRTLELHAARHPGDGAHGSGCTHAAALAALLAQRQEPLAAARQAQELAGAAVRHRHLGLGSGAAPANLPPLR